MEVVEWCSRARCSRTSSASSTSPAARRSASPARRLPYPRQGAADGRPQRPDKEHDVGQVARSSRSTRASFAALQDDQFIPVISPLGFVAPTTRTTTSPPTSSRCKLAEVLNAEKLMMLTNTSRVLDQSGQPAHVSSAARDRRAVRPRHDLGRMLPNISSALDAAKNGVTPCTSSRRACRMRCCSRSSPNRRTERYRSR